MVERPKVAEYSLATECHLVAHEDNAPVIIN